MRVASVECIGICAKIHPTNHHYAWTLMRYDVPVLSSKFSLRVQRNYDHTHFQWPSSVEATQQLWKDIKMGLYTQKHPISRPSRASYGVAFVMILDKVNHVSTAPHWICYIHYRRDNSISYFIGPCYGLDWNTFIALWDWFSRDVLPLTCCEHGPPSITAVHFSKFSIATNILFN